MITPNLVIKYKCGCERCGQELLIEMNRVNRSYESPHFSYLVESEDSLLQDWINIKLYWSRKIDLYLCGECKEELDDMLKKFLELD